MQESGAEESGAEESGAEESGPEESGSREAEWRITARGAALAMFALFLVGNLAAESLNLGGLAGSSFVAGCLLAGMYTQRRHLLPMVTTPPVIFLIALLCAEMLTSPGSTFTASAEAVAAGTILALSAAAPWLFGGVLLCLVIAMFRGLPQCVRDLRMNLAGQPGVADRRAN